MKHIVVLALAVLISSPAWADDSANARTSSSAAAQSADQLYSAWEANNRTNHELAHMAGKDFVAQFPSDTRATKVKAWMTVYEKIMEPLLWQKAEAGESAQTVQAYLDKYPTGSHAAAAEDKLAAIKKAEAEMKPGKVFRDCPDCPEMVILPKPFAMGKYEVTQGQWKAVMGNNPSHFSNCGDSCPVEEVSWNDAQEFIQKLNSKTGKQYRLPTEAEWEYACYGGSQTVYCGGNDLDAVGWADSPHLGRTHPAGQKQANGYGLYDMSGNVWEWMENKYDNEHDWRVLRGGSWFDGPQDGRAADRGRVGPAGRGSGDGFRLARTLP